MAESFVLLPAEVSTADAERLCIEYRRGDVLVRFNDWRERPIVLQFPDAAAFRWQDEAALPSGVRDDSSYEVMDSAWVTELSALNSLPPEPHHYLLCFNAAGVLEVVSGRLMTEV